jgi:hypothetical protein
MGWMRSLFLGGVAQNLEIKDIQERLDRMRDEKTPAAWTQEKQIAALQEETHDLRLRLGVLIKLLVGKNLLSAHEIASMIAALEPEDPK